MERKTHRSELRIFWDERLKLPPLARILLAWAATLSVFVACSMIVITYARSFGETRFRMLILTWGFGLVQTVTIEEPVMIWVFMLIPWIVESVTRNELTGELLKQFMGSTIGQCVDGILSL
jgi:hypothetical protein